MKPNALPTRPPNGPTSGKGRGLPPGTPAAGDAMQPGQLLTAGASITSASGRFRLTYQGDGNLVLYRTTDGAALWDIRPQPGGPGECIMQGDGNLVVYDAAATAVWASGTAGDPGAHLVLQDDGNLVVYRADGTAAWASGTVEGIFRYDLTQVDGWVQVELRRDGTVRFSGHAHNDAALSEAVQYTVRVAVGRGAVAVLQHSGNLAGLGGTPQERNDYWDETSVRPDVSQHYDALVTGKFQVFEYRKGAVLGELTQMLDFLATTLTGLFITPEIGLVLFLGGEIAGLAKTGSLVPAAEILSGTFCMLGPSGSLYALAGEALAEIGQRRRPISDQEYAWANAKVFSGTLAPKEQIVVTDTIGAAGRAFTFPGPGDITVNLGPASFADPMTADPGTFIHELTHVWQLHNNPAEADWVATAFAAQLGNVPYAYGPPGPPYSAFNIEQQAMIVQDWFARCETAGHELDDDPYFGYIRDNIRRGQL